MNGKFFLLLVLSALIFGACAAPSPSPAPTLALPTGTPVPPARPSATTVPPTSAPTATRVPATATPAPVTLKQMAEKIAANAGKVMQVVEGDPKRVIFVFEELHDSRLGQVEIAIMLSRLYEDYGLKHIGLEGHPAEKGVLKLTWAHRKPYFQAKQPMTPREDVILTTLKEGAISSAEMMGLVYADVVIDGIDDAKLYAFEPPAGAEDAPLDYLYQIARVRMNNVQRTAWQALYDSKKYDDAFKFAMSVDKFTADTWARLSDPINIASAEESLALVDQIKAEAQKAGAKLTAEQQKNLEAMRENLKVMSQRSDAMAANMLKVAAANPGAPLAMTVGALHTARLKELLTKAGVSFAVVRPESLAKGSKAGLLSPEAFARKMKGQSVAPAGHLGAILEGRKKPTPFADKAEYQLEEAVRTLAQHLIQQALDAMAKVATKEISKLSDAEVKQLLQAELKRLADDAVLAKGSLEGTTFPLAELFNNATIRDVRLMEGNLVIVDVLFDLPSLKFGGTFTASQEKKAQFIEEYLSEEKRDLEKETEPPEEPKPSDPPKPQRICSNTEVTWGKGG